MCHDPNELPDGTVVACRKCELCRYNRVKDWAGRNIAQAKVSSASFACTLTYGPELDGDRMPIPGRSDHIRASVLTYSDVQKFLKYLRWAGYPLDYFITGEIGSLTSRAHWHIILHFRDKVPTHELEVNFSDRHANEFGQVYKHTVCDAWPHGFMFWKKATFGSVFYNCKYILKDEGDEASQRKPGMSKKPPLGAAYFIRQADLHVEQHLAPQTLEYRHKGVNKKDGSPITFMLKGRTAEIYLERFISRWKQVHGDKPRPKSDLVDLFEQYGKIVTDEARMLLREEFPKGESRARMPTGERIKEMAEEAKAERDQRMQDMAEAEQDDWSQRWIRSAESGEERQRRTGLIAFERGQQQQLKQEQFEKFLEYKSQHGWQFISGAGWVHEDGRSAGPGIGGVEKFGEWLSRQPVEQPWRKPEPHERGELGKVGRWNRAYGQSADDDDE